MRSLARWCLIPSLLSIAAAQDRPTGDRFSTRSTVWAQHGIAATSQPLATATALRILRLGGSAVDAAIAANAVLCVVEPTGCGIGGDLFAMVWDPEAEALRGYNGSGRSPAALTREWFVDNGYDAIPAFGPLPVSVPGAVQGWCDLHDRFGRLPLAQVLAPAVGYARDGAPITQVIAHYWQVNEARIADQPGFAKVFLPGGTSPREGDIWRNPGLAETLAAIGEEGRAAFYEGERARTISAFVREHGGFLAYEDLAGHAGEWVDPVSTTYRGVELWELPPNGQGIAALQILNLIEPYDIAAMGWGSAEWVHLFTEAKKIAFEDRARFYADPAMVDVPLARLVSKDYAEQRRQLIDLERAARSVTPAALEGGDTIYLTVADASGMMVSWIQSNYRGMGSGVTPPGLGFVLQDRGELFDLRPGHANSYAPGKRPFHTIIPAFATRDGEPWLSFGVMGGAMQPQGHVQILVHMLDFGMGLQEAGDAPRIRHGGSSQPTGEVMADGGVLYLERGLAESELAALRASGHDVRVGGDGHGGYQAILWDARRRVYAAASESRKDGHAAGY